MKFTLKDYQEEAVRDVLRNLKDARHWKDRGRKSAFSLTATTGAGKTVMAAAVIEALFFGNDELDIAPDPSAVVIWFSDDPSLNTQSQWRLLEASDKLTVSDIVPIEKSFTADKLERGKVYVLNTQKLGRNSLLVRGHDPEAASDSPRLMPDDRAFTIWDIIQNTIETPGLTLYLVLDEAHRGMKDAKGSADVRPTIVRQLINGTGTMPGIPIVWGISATVERFNKAMVDAKDRMILSPVVVDALKVQASGLIKELILLDVKNEKTGDFSTVMLRRATARLKEMMESWAEYAKAQEMAQPVLPLMVLQIPNSPDPNEIGEWLDLILAEMPELSSENVANVLGERRTERFGRYSISYIEPQRVQESDNVRVLIAKDAISMGWDCPRAEVMVSFRAASDQTYITQLLGRMVRTPLARRIPGNDRLNAVDCILPFFDSDMAQKVVASLVSGNDLDYTPPVSRVLIRPIDLAPNKDIPAEAWTKLLSLPSQSLPRKHARPVKRLTILAHELAFDGIVEGAGGKAHKILHAVLDELRVKLQDEIARARQSVLEVEGLTIRADLASGGMSFNDFVEAADSRVIGEAYGRARRIISPDVARTYAEHVAKGLPIRDEIDALLEAHEIIAALGLVPDVRLRLEEEAERIARDWLMTYNDTINALTDERREAYREVREMSTKPPDSTIARPSAWKRETTERLPEGTERALDRWDRHLLSGEDGLFPMSYGSDWERKVLTTELKRPDVIGWYRNPGHPTQDSLGIAYEEGGEPKILRPDFIFFAKDARGSLHAEIVNPHDPEKSNSLPMLLGLAAYAESHPGTYRRIAAVAVVDRIYRVLDLTHPEAREAVRAAPSAKAAYLGSASKSYSA
jgi:type III restriction enzyme